MEEKISEVLENILSLLGLQGSFEIEEKEDGVYVAIDIEEPGILIGRGGETLAALQLLLNLAASRHFKDDQYEQSSTTYKRVLVDVSSWRKSKEEELAHKARGWAQKVIETKEPMELLPMPSWQRRIVHITIESTPGVKSESIGEGIDRHLVISPAD